MFKLSARRLALSSVVVGTLALVGAPAAAGQSVADATCPGPGMADLGGSTDYRLAQTFTAQTTGNLTDAQVELNQTGSSAGPTGDYVISINTVNVVGAPTNSVLASATLRDEDVPGGYATVLVTFAAPAPVTSGQRYAVVVTRPGPTHSLAVRAFAGDTCAGEAFISTSQTAQFVTVASVCACPEDLVFAVFVEPASAPQPQPQPQPAAKASRDLTLDASKSKIEEGKKVLLSGGLESASVTCKQGQAVELERKAKGKPDSAYASFKQVQSDAGGEFAAKVRVKKTYIYRAIVNETQACLAAASNTRKVRVKKRSGTT